MVMMYFKLGKLVKTLRCAIGASSSGVLSIVKTKYQGIETFDVEK
jgi:hypothetical protein